MNDGSVRAFLALEIPDAVRSKLQSAQRQLKNELTPARWTKPAGWHLTLKFLGQVEQPVLVDLVADLAQRLQGAETVKVVLERTGFFPSSTRPRVAWVGGVAEGVDNVVAAVEAATTAAGFPPERRRWTPHVTLARLKSQWSKTAVDYFFTWGDNLDLDPFTCREVVLFKSDLQPGGAVYTALERIPLE
jgi:2'-5' RNA ligase